jgi:uncharacterized protein involved in exopolysaccharide biosynthesis
MDESRFDPLDYVSVFHRRKWWFIVPLTLALVIGGLLVWKLPRTYQAATTIAVSAARVSPNMIGAVEIDRQERMRAVSQQLLSRTVLERAAQLEHLDQGSSIDAAVNRVRGGLSVSLPDSITPGGAAGSAPSQQLSPEQKAQLDTYEVRFVDDSPVDAQRIVNRLAQVFVEENSKSREVRATDTSQFIEGQLRASEGRLKTLELKLREMKETFMGRLPEQTNSNLAMVSAMQRQLESASTSTRGEQDRLSMIERQIESMQQGADEAIAATHGTPAETAASRVLALKRDLANAQLAYTDKHPEIIRLKDEIATAERAAAAEKSRPVADRLAILARTEYRQLLWTATPPRCGSPSRSASRQGSPGKSASAGPRRSRAARRTAAGVAPARVRPRADLLRRADAETPGRAPQRRAAAQAGRRAVRGPGPGGPPRGAVQAEADAGDVDGDRGGTGARRRVRVRPRVSRPLGPRRPRSA